MRKILIVLFISYFSKTSANSGDGRVWYLACKQLTQGNIELVYNNNFSSLKNQLKNVIQFLKPRVEETNDDDFIENYYALKKIYGVVSTSNDYQQLINVLNQFNEKNKDFIYPLLGYCHEKGIGTEKSLIKALDFYQIAGADFTNKVTKITKKIQSDKILKAYRNKITNIKNKYYYEALPLLKRKKYKKAFNIVKEAARHGIIDAEYYLGFMYFFGKGTSKNQLQGIHWLSKSFKHGEIKACKILVLSNIVLKNHMCIKNY